MMFKQSNLLLVFLVTIILSACSTTSHRDGPPRFKVDVSRIPDAVPKVEPLSKYGNKPYRVFGKSYSVLPSSKNYEERGIASWYGTKFDSNLTSSGERYDMLTMTAAHKSLPLPTYAQVTNLENGKKVIVKINDRGPFESHRLIDLSYAAAKKLGMLAHGTARVIVKAIDPMHWDKQMRIQEHGGIFWAKNNKSTKRHSLLSLFQKPHHEINKPKIRIASSHKQMYLQVASFKNKTHALQFKRRISSLILPFGVAISETLQPQPNYRVQIGPVKDSTALQHITQRLKAAGFKNKPFIQYRMEA